MKQTLARYCAMGRQQRLGRCLLQQHRAGAHAQREHQQPAQSEGEGQRRAADEDVVGGGAQHVRRPAAAGGDHVAVKVHRALGHAGGAGGEREQATVVGRGVHGVERVGLQGHRSFQRARITRIAVEQQHLAQLRAGRAHAQQCIGQPRVAQCVGDLRLVDDGLQLPLTQQRHGAHRDAAGLDHTEPAGRHHRRVGAAQQHAVARHQAQLVHQHAGNAVGAGLQVGVGPAHRLALVQALHAQAAAGALRHRAVQQFGGHVQPLGQMQLGQLEAELRQRLGRRQVVTGEGVDVRAGGHAGSGTRRPRSGHSLAI